jgi:hypothetical protein
VIPPLGPVLRVLAWWLFWHAPIAEPYEAPLPEWWNGGRVYTSDALHVGIRPAASFGDGVGLTLQLTTGGW